MTIAVIGTGMVGGTLGTRWAQAGHTVLFGVRNPESDKVREVVAGAGSNARAVTVADAARLAETVVLATPWSATRDAVTTCGDLDGKILVDCTNPLKPKLEGLELGTTTSGAEVVADWASGARVVKAFNTTGFGNMANPIYDGRATMMPICGDDTDAKGKVLELARDLGFDVIDAGPLTAARYLEPVAMFWIHLAYAAGMGRDFALRIERR